MYSNLQGMKIRFVVILFPSFLFNHMFLFSMLDFGFRCGSPTHVNGVSIPLISVSIAGLMAIFVDPFLSDRVSESAVSITIRQATSSLLDHRLSATSASANYGLDPSTCKKMVKAINKVRETAN